MLPPIAFQGLDGLSEEVMYVDALDAAFRNDVGQVAARIGIEGHFHGGMFGQGIVVLTSAFEAPKSKQELN